MAELSLWLDYYDDIYSDFDSRHYIKRRISEDFLYELRMAFNYKKERVNDLMLLLPKERRNDTAEPVIADSLKDFFIKQYTISADKYRRKVQSGIVLLISGILIVIINAFMGYRMIHSFGAVVTKVILEPAGWFLLWTAMETLFYDLKEVRKDKKFFRELADLNVHFKSS